MDLTMAVNLMWDVGTGISVGLLAYGALLCLEHRLGGDEPKASSFQAAPARPVLPGQGRFGSVD
ncbi:MAG TPA: hypothetical protein VH881_08030 [Burkholderiales bacterium]|jgi:hypothetical protein